MFHWNILLYVTLFIGVYCDTDNIIVPCKKDDEHCHNKSANIALPKFFEGIPALGIEPSDPVHVDEIIGDLSILKYKFIDSSFTGFKNCEVHHVKLDWNKSKLRFNLTCPNVIVSGKYEISGRLIILPVEGNGDFRILTKTYEFGYDMDIKEIQGKDGKTYMMVKKYKVDADPQENITYDFKNLFNGQEDLANAVLTFANQNWKEVADFVQEPVVSAFMKKLVANLNKCFKKVSVDKLFLP